MPQARYSPEEIRTISADRIQADRFAGQGQRPYLAERGEIPQQPADLVLDAAAAFCDHRDLVNTPHQRQCQCATKDRPFDGGRRCGGVLEHPFGVCDCLVELVFEGSGADATPSTLAAAEGG